MNGVQPFQFEPTYTPVEEPTKLEKESEGKAKVLTFNARGSNTEWYICGGNCVACPRQMNVFAAKNFE